MVGRTVGFGRYQLLGLLGRGGMGSVYEAEHLSLRRRVALKVLDPALTRQPDFVQRFHREVETIAHLEHPNILPVYDSGEEDGLLYLVMLLVRGGTLKDRLQLEPAPWPARQVLRIAQQVLAALDAAHQQGIIHRDIKPDNILLHSDRALLADFGIAKLMQGDSGLTVVGTFMGTPDYAAPEQVLALPLDGRSDLYAFGVVLYELLTGRVPYRADTPMGVALQHVQGQLPPPWEMNPNLPLPIAKVLVRALAREREARYASGPEFAEALERAVKEAEGLAIEPGSAPAVDSGSLPYVHPIARQPDVQSHVRPTVIDPEFRQQAAQRERERLEAETRERERLDAEERERQRVEAAALAEREQERLEAEARERERLEAEARERERLEAETREGERLEAEARERQRVEATAQAARERERLEAEARERERLAAEARERERLAGEERKRQEAEARERERLAAEERKRQEEERKRQEAEERRRQRAAAASARAAATAATSGGVQPAASRQRLLLAAGAGVIVLLVALVVLLPRLGSPPEQAISPSLAPVVTQPPAVATSKPAAPTSVPAASAPTGTLWPHCHRARRRQGTGGGR